VDRTSSTEWRNRDVAIRHSRYFLQDGAHQGQDPLERPEAALRDLVERADTCALQVAGICAATSDTDAASIGSIALTPPVTPASCGCDSARHCGRFTPIRADNVPRENAIPLTGQASRHGCGFAHAGMRVDSRRHARGRYIATRPPTPVTGLDTGRHSTI